MFKKVLTSLILLTVMSVAALAQIGGNIPTPTIWWAAGDSIYPRIGLRDLVGIDTLKCNAIASLALSADTVIADSLLRGFNLRILNDAVIDSMLAVGDSTYLNAQLTVAGLAVFDSTVTIDDSLHVTGNSTFLQAVSADSVEADHHVGVNAVFSGAVNADSVIASNYTGANAVLDTLVKAGIGVESPLLYTPGATAVTIDSDTTGAGTINIGQPGDADVVTLSSNVVGFGDGSLGDIDISLKVDTGGLAFTWMEWDEDRTLTTFYHPIVTPRANIDTTDTNYIFSNLVYFGEGTAGDQDIVLSFHESDAEHTLGWDDGVGRFEFSDQIYALNNVRSSVSFTGGSLLEFTATASTIDPENGGAGTLSLGETGDNDQITVVGALTQSVATIAADDTTPSVAGANIFVTSANSGVTTITDLDDPAVGQIVHVIGGSNTNPSRIADGGNFNLSAAWDANLDDVLILFVQADNDYIEIGRVDN